jgi:peroxiredoxin 2/4
MKKFGLMIIPVFCVLTVMAQNGIPLIGSKAPSFEASTTNGKLKFPGDFGGSWKILFSHPADFTPVCSTEIMQLAKMQTDFEALNVKIAVISTDDLPTHKQWKQAMEDYFKNGENVGEIEFPLIDDSNRQISEMYGMYNPSDKATTDVRGVFIIGPDNIVQAINFYPRSIGRNLDEIKRIIIALQTSQNEDVYTPVNWKPGDDVLVKNHPSTGDVELKENSDTTNSYYMVGLGMWYKRVNIKVSDK